MKLTKILLSGVAAASLTSIAAPAFAQAESSAQAAPADETSDEDIVVTGIRASLQSAQQRKRDATQIVDSIVADDIGKLMSGNILRVMRGAERVAKELQANK